MEVKALEQSIVSLLEGALQFLGNCFGDLQAHLTTTPESFGGGGAWDAVLNINRGIQGLGYGLLIMFFLMSLCKSITNFKDLSLQSAIGWIVRFILVKFLIDYGVQILNFIINIAMGANEIIFDQAGSFEFAQVPQEVLDAVNAMEQAAWYERLGAFFQMIPMYIVCFITMLIIWVCGVVMVITVYLRFFRVYIFSALAPIPLSTFGSPETSSTGKHFLKAYAGVCLEICVIAVGIVIFSALISSQNMIFPSWMEDTTGGVNGVFWDTLMNYMLQLAMQSIMLVICITSANKYIRDILGN